MDQKRFEEIKALILTTDGLKKLKKDELIEFITLIPFSDQKHLKDELEETKERLAELEDTDKDQEIMTLLEVNRNKSLQTKVISGSLIFIIILVFLCLI